MTGLPEAHLAIVDEFKITHYLLSGTHPAGRTKGDFFRRFGFRLSEWQRLRDALLDHAFTASVIATSDTEFGRKYVLDGALRTPTGRKPWVRAVWFLAIGAVAPRLVTVYPARRAAR